MMTTLGPHTSMDQFTDQTWADAGFRLSWPGQTAGGTLERPATVGEALAEMLRRALSVRALSVRSGPCTGWPVALSAPAPG